MSEQQQSLGEQDLEILPSVSIESTEDVGREAKGKHRARPESILTSGGMAPRTSSSAGAIGNYRQQPVFSPSSMMNTINQRSINTTDGLANGESANNIPSPNHFFGSQLYDSDGSDGSIVFSYQPPVPAQDVGRRDRFPSFDSSASTGSLRFVPPGTGSTMPHVFPNQNLSKVNPQLLPYDQRRKLLQQRRQQQVQRSQEPTPPRPEAGRYMQFAQPPDAYHYHAGQIPSPAGGMGMGMGMGGMHPAPSAGYNAPPNYTQQPHLSQLQNASFQQQQPYRLSPYRSTTPPRFDRPPAAASKHAGRNRPYSHSQPQQLPPPPAPLHAHSLPPSGLQRSSSGGAISRGVAMSESSANGDKDSNVPHRSYRNYIHNQSNLLELNPPPPPPLSHDYHVRTDSTGSVSSLGSQGSKEDDAEQGRRSHRLHRRSYGGNGGGSGGGSSGGNILQMLNPWSPKQATLTDFHRMNQEFLKKTGRKAVINVTSPKQQRERIGSLEHPPPSRGTHKRLPSIDNDDWTERDEEKNSSVDDSLPSSPSTSGESSSADDISSSQMSDYEEGFHTRQFQDSEEANERTSLLPPSGISSNEHLDVKNSYTEGHHSRRSRNHSRQKTSQRHRQQNQEYRAQDYRDSMVTVKRGNVASGTTSDRKTKERKQKKKKKHYRRNRRTKHIELDDSTNSSDGSDSYTTSSSSYDYRQWTRKRAKMLEKERAKLIAQWKEEAKAEAEAAQREAEANRWYRRLARCINEEFGEFLNRAFKFYATAEAFICNLPLTIGAIAMAIVTLGVVWFKFAEENLDSCEPVHFHSSQCTFPEFPGCFYCDKTAMMYKVAVNFHFACSAIAGILAFSFVAKMLLATKVVLDEMSSPTTASPAGLLCMTTVCVFAGRGLIGQLLVSAAACVHLCLVIWFIYMALAYHIMPEPSWFPNTVGVGLSAVKAWLYYPMSGHFLMAISLSLLFFLFPISLIRVVLNEKISATVGWMQMSAPAISLYALTIMAQPSFEEEHPDITRFQRVHRMVYLPCMHVMFAMSVIGMIASLQSLWVRWGDFKKREFSPAHAAFCFPTLSHANAVQAYRGAVNSFSDVHPGSPAMVCLYIYWVIVLGGGTIATFWITAKFFYCLPSWTNIDVEDEEEPPAPYETTMTRQNVIATGETLVQPFVSPAVLQANETGALVMLPRSGEDGRQRFVRTRKLTALGFEPIMKWSEMERERELLLEWVGKNPPRRRNRTLSVPGIDFSYGTDIGTGSGVYGVDGHPRLSPGSRRQRSNTGTTYTGARSFY